MQKIDFKSKGNDLREAFHPIQITEIDGTAIRLVRIQGEYHWHIHPEEDEFFIVVQGELTVEFQDHTLHLHEWEGIQIPKGAPHRTRSETGAVVLIIEPAHTDTRGVRIEDLGGPA